MREKRTARFLGNNAEAGALIKAPSRVPVLLSLIRSFWGSDAHLSAFFWAEGVSPEANPADAPRQEKAAFQKTKRCGSLSSTPESPTAVLHSRRHRQITNDAAITNDALAHANH